MIRTQDQAQNEKRLTFKSKRLQPKSVWLTAALFDIRPRDRLLVGRWFTNNKQLMQTSSCHNVAIHFV